MSAHFDAVRARRAEAEAAREKLSTARAEASRLQRQVTELRCRADELRQLSLTQRVAAAAGGAEVGAQHSAAEVLEAELNAEAAEQARDAVIATISDLERAAAAAEEKVSTAEADYLIAEVETPAMAEIDRLFDEIAAHAGRAIGAARIVWQRDHRRGRHIYDLQKMFGPAGALVLALNNLEWPKLPVDFRASAFQIRNLRNPCDFPGVSEAEEKAHELLEAI